MMASLPPRHALRLHRHRLEHHAAARRRASTAAGCARSSRSGAFTRLGRGDDGRRDPAESDRRGRRGRRRAARGWPATAGAERVRVVATAAIRGARQPRRALRGGARRAGRRRRGPRRRGGGAARLRRRDATLGRAAAGRRGRRRRRRLDRDRGRHAARRRRLVRVAAVGSGALAERHLRSATRRRRPSSATCAPRRRRVRPASSRPTPTLALAVGGSATSLPRWSAAVLDDAALERGARGAARASRPPRSRGASRSHPSACGCCPPGILCSSAACGGLGRPLQIGRGGLREGVLLELAVRVAEPMAKAARDRRSAPDEPYRAAAARIVRVARAASCSSRPTASSTPRDIERVHDMRVARGACARCWRSSRRASRRRSSSGVLRDVKRLADALGERRDPDVQLDALERVRGRQVPAAGASPACARARRPSSAQRAGAAATSVASPPSSSGVAASRGLRERPARARRRRRRAAEPEPRTRVKARAVKGLDPDGDAGRQRASGSSRVRLDELCSFMPARRRPGARSRRCTTCGSPPSGCATSSRSTEPCFGPYAETATKRAKDLQDLLGEIHDCDVQLPRVRGARRASCAPRTPQALRARRRRRARPRSRRCSRRRRTRASTRGLAALLRLPARPAARCCSSASSRCGATSSARASARGSSTRSPSDRRRPFTVCTGRRQPSTPAETRSASSQHASHAEPPSRRPRPTTALYFNRELSWLRLQRPRAQLAEDDERPAARAR